MDEVIDRFSIFNMDDISPELYDRLMETKYTMTLGHIPSIIDTLGLLESYMLKLEEIPKSTVIHLDEIVNSLRLGLYNAPYIHYGPQISLILSRLYRLCGEFRYPSI